MRARDLQCGNINATDNQIYALVYERYGLREEENEIVEDEKKGRFCRVLQFEEDRTMNHAWQGSLGEANSLTQNGTFVEVVERGFADSYGRMPSADERQAWQGSLPETIFALAGRLSHDVGVVVEYRLPFNGQRADLVLLGRSSNRPIAHVVELKHWAASTIHPSLEHFVLTGGIASPHPSYQAANYAGKLRYFHSLLENWAVSSSALVLDSSPDLHMALKDGKYFDLWTTAPVFLPGEAAIFADYLGAQIPDPPSNTDIAGFLDGSYSQSLRLLDAISKHQHLIMRRAIASLAVSGWGLSDDQLEIYDRIMVAVARGESAVFLLSGGPGSGKTLLAIHLLLALAASGKRTVLAVRNNRLNAALKAVIDFKPFGAGGMVKYFSTLPRGRHGVEDDRGPIADVLICDEGQRLSLNSDNVFRRAPITIILYDEDQILNDGESGTTDNLLALATALGESVHQSTLPTLHRCRGGQEYVRWVDALLASVDELHVIPRHWQREYTFSVVKSPGELIDVLTSIQGPGIRKALLASFTRSSGKPTPATSQDLGKIRIPEVTPPVHWLMDPNTEYVPFWVNGHSNKLTHCSSIYGCQGFETDFAGLIWGDDLVIRKGEWQTGNPDNCYDAAPGATRLSTIMRRDPSTALRLLRNRYRILLTRGIFGTYVFCEDPETQEFLASLMRSEG